MATILVNSFSVLHLHLNCSMPVVRPIRAVRVLFFQPQSLSPSLSLSIPPWSSLTPPARAGGGAAATSLAQPRHPGPKGSVHGITRGSPLRRPGPLQGGLWGVSSAEYTRRLPVYD